MVKQQPADRFIDDLRDIIAQHTAPDIAEAVVSTVQQRYGGGEPYIHAPRRSKRAAIEADLRRGIPVSAICERHGVSRTWVYRVLHSM